jgi:HlyD family secretion protein
MVLLASCRQASRDFDAVGTLERDRIDLVAEAAEPIAALAVREGDSVSAGALIVRLEPTRIAAEVAQAVAARDRAAARFSELEYGPRQEDIAAGRAALAAAEAALRRLRLDLERARSLRRDAVVAQAELDAAEAAHAEAVAQRDRLRANLAALLAGTRREEIDQARAAVAEAEAAVAAARVHLERLEVRAPVAGRVDSLPYEIGERPPPGAVVAVLLAAGAPYARVYVPEALRVDVKAGSAATVWVDGVAGELRGRVRTVSADPSFTPYYALTERDRGHLVYVAEIDLLDATARDLPAGVPLQVHFPRRDGRGEVEMDG